MIYLILLLCLIFATPVYAQTPQDDYRLLIGNGKMTNQSGTVLDYWELGLFKDESQAPKELRLSSGVSFYLANQKWGLGFTKGYFVFLTMFHLRGTAWLFHNQSYNSLAGELNLSLPAILFGGNFFAGINGGVGYEVFHFNNWQTNFYTKLGLNFGLGTALFNSSNQ